ncbi:Maleate isomerase [Pontivivens insulae]|uniref:Maleate isomerase n=1 Tax=Pontivivens insulae TaxID=1639689 RepID=A0A2R8A8U7_9RHOB|nr:maleate isomerase [Pontivivens insulae]SPF28646.1 Maleate isomerase [Pontivivens insulae]
MVHTTFRAVQVTICLCLIPKVSRRFSYELAPSTGPAFGLIVLRADETLERDVGRMVPPALQPLVTRVESGNSVTPDSLRAMEARLTGAAALFPDGHRFDVIGYGCTSATAQIGAGAVAARIRAGASTQHVTEPVSATIAACRALGLQSLAILSPYVEVVSAPLRDCFRAAGIATPVFGTFDEPVEANVVRIDADSIRSAAASLVHGVDGLFLSCTNLRVLDLIEELEDRLAMPVLSSNQTLLWHMSALAGHPEGVTIPGRLGAAQLS